MIKLYTSKEEGYPVDIEGICKKFNKLQNHLQAIYIDNGVMFDSYHHQVYERKHIILEKDRSKKLKESSFYEKKQNLEKNEYSNSFYNKRDYRERKNLVVV